MDSSVPMVCSKFVANQYRPKICFVCHQKKEDHTNEVFTAADDHQEANYHTFSNDTDTNDKSSSVDIQGEILSDSVQQVTIDVEAHEIIQSKITPVAQTTISECDIQSTNEIEELYYESCDEAESDNEPTLRNENEEKLQIPLNDEASIQQPASVFTDHEKADDASRKSSEMQENHQESRASHDVFESLNTSASSLALAKGSETVSRRQTISMDTLSLRNLQTSALNIEEPSKTTECSKFVPNQFRPKMCCHCYRKKEDHPHTTNEGEVPVMFRKPPERVPNDNIHVRRKDFSTNQPQRPVTMINTEIKPDNSLITSQKSNSSEKLQSSYLHARGRESNIKTGNRRNTVTVLQETFQHAKNKFEGSGYRVELNPNVEFFEYNVILLGSPRVGKSQLINALCGGKTLAETSPKLGSCTLTIKKYVLEGDGEPSSDLPPCRVNFYDTPGIESWVNNDGEQTMVKLIDETDPICVIFCASPGCFADLTQLRPILRRCKETRVFCALVCTNMWNGNRRDSLIAEFKEELQFFGPKLVTYSEDPLYLIPHEITFFGTGALCTMVNSVEYFDSAVLPKPMPVQGVDELIQGIMQSLDETKLLGWCRVVEHCTSFCERVSQSTNKYFHLPFLKGYTMDYNSAANVALFAAKLALKLYFRV